MVEPARKVKPKVRISAGIIRVCDCSRTLEKQKLISQLLFNYNTLVSGAAFSLPSGTSFISMAFAASPEAALM